MNFLFARSISIYIHKHNFINNKLLKSIILILLTPFGIVKFAFLKAMGLFLYEDNLKYNLGITAIIKNEATYIEEWIEYHRLIGFSLDK